MGEKVQAQVLEADKERRRLRLGIKQLEPTSIDEYIAERKAGDTVSGRIVRCFGRSRQGRAGRGRFRAVQAACGAGKAREASAGASKADLSSLTAMLSAKWKSGGAGEAAAGTAEGRSDS